MKKILFLFLLCLPCISFAGSHHGRECSGVYKDSTSAWNACSAARGTSCGEWTIGYGENSCGTEKGYHYLPEWEAPWIDFGYNLSGTCPEGTEPDAAGKCEEPSYDCMENLVIDARRGGDWTLAGSNNLCTDQAQGLSESPKLCSYELTAGAYLPSMDYTTGAWKSTGSKCETSSEDATIMGHKPLSEKDQWTEDGRKTIHDSNETVPNSVCSDNGDGTQTCMTIEQQTDQEIIGQGPLIRGRQSHTSYTEFDGNTRNTTTTTTTTDDGNGTVTEEKQTTIVFLPGGSTTKNTTDNGSTTETTTGPGLQQTTTTTTTTTTNPDGSTSTETSTEGASGGGGGEDGTGDADEDIEGDELEDVPGEEELVGAVDGVGEEIINLPTSIDANDFASPVSGACPSPISFSVFGEPFEISYDPLCSFAGMLRPLFLAVGMLVAAGIVMRGDN